MLLKKASLLSEAQYLREETGASLEIPSGLLTGTVLARMFQQQL